MANRPSRLRANVALAQRTFCDNVRAMQRKMVNLVELVHVVELVGKYASHSIIKKGFQAAGLDRAMLDGAPGFIPYAAEAVLLETIARAIGDRHLGARLGRDFDYLAYGAYSSYVLGAPDLASALDRGRRALYLTHPGSEIALRETDSHLVVGRNSKGLYVIGHRHLDEGALFVIGHVARHFLGSDWVPDWLEIPDTNTGDIDTLRDLSGTEVRAGAQMPGVAIRLTDLAAANPGQHQSKETITRGELEALMGIDPMQTMEDAVVQMLNVTFATRLSDERTIARLLAITPRSLQRALKDEGTSFRQVRAHAVAHRARSLLSGNAAPIEEIATELGYTEPRSFRRAFNKATGQSPSAFRAACKAG